MRVGGAEYRTIWLGEDGETVRIIDQTRLPHEFVILDLETVADAAHAIRTMEVRGAPLIGATAAYGLALAMREDPSDKGLEAAKTLLGGTRPTAVNLLWAIDDVGGRLRDTIPSERQAIAYARAAEICDEDVAICRSIGEHGAGVIEALAAEQGGESVNLLTHCNAGWLATVDWGTALAPVYVAHERGIPIHVWVDETRPRNQGAGLTAWELGQHGVPHTVITDNVGGHLMQRGQVDVCVTGTDRTTATGDVANKIGTYLKALAARDTGIPFYVALPGPTIDWSLSDGADIPIEQRDGKEVSEITGITEGGSIATVRITPDGSPVANYAFDVTPARLVTGLITERGVCAASREGLAELYPEKAGG